MEGFKLDSKIIELLIRESFGIQGEMPERISMSYSDLKEYTDALSAVLYKTIVTELNKKEKDNITKINLN